MSADGERLQKVLARAGMGSRRACEELIAAGRVTVNGRRASLGDRATAADDIAVDGVRVSADDPHVYYALHKPAGVITTASDPGRRPTVLDLVPLEPRVFPVGRLDIDTAGLLLLTNDGDFAQRVSHPSFEVPKVYMAEVRGSAGRGHLARIRKGVELDDGVARAAATVVDSRNGRTLLELTVHEGRNRMVRRLLDAVDLPVANLVRTGVGPVRLGRLKAGTWRNLSHEEVVSLLGREGRT